MRSVSNRTLSAVVGIMLPVAALLAVAVWYRVSGAAKEEGDGGPEKLKPAVVSVDSGSIELTPQVVKLSGMQIAMATEPTRRRKLELRGQLVIDPGRLHAVNSRFPGQIMEIALVDEPTLKSPGKPIGAAPKRQLSSTDRVTKGQRLGVVWSKDLGEKKSELVDAQARLMLDQITLNRLKGLAEKGSIAERSVREAEKNVSLGVIAAEKAARTLRSWGISDEEIDRVKSEAESVNQAGVGEKRTDTNWARVDVVAPIDGTVVEKNITMGDIVDTNDELFKIADLSVMAVWLHAYEEDLMYLRRVGLPIQAEIRLPANPDLGVLEATIDRIGDIIDPNEHMALLIGFDRQRQRRAVGRPVCVGQHPHLERARHRRDPDQRPDRRGKRQLRLRAARPRGIAVRMPKGVGRQAACGRGLHPFSPRRGPTAKRAARIARRRTDRFARRP